MKSIALRVALLTLSGVLFAPRAEAQCPTSWTYWNPSVYYPNLGSTGNGHCYSFTASPSDWLTAEATANTFGAHLASVLDQTEASFLYNNFQDPSHPSFFIGLTDATTEGTYAWTTGEPVNYTKWWFGQPDNAGNQDYSEFTGGYWYDISQETVEYGVMELDPSATTSTPEPAAVLLVATGLLGILAVRRRSAA